MWWSLVLHAVQPLPLITLFKSHQLEQASKYCCSEAAQRRLQPPYNKTKPAARWTVPSSIRPENGGRAGLGVESKHCMGHQSRKGWWTMYVLLNPNRRAGEDVRLTLGASEHFRVAPCVRRRATGVRWALSIHNDLCKNIAPGLIESSRLQQCAINLQNPAAPS